MSGYKIFFGVWRNDSLDSQLIELPVNPQEVSITYPGNPTNYDVEGIGDIIIPRIPKLATVTFESFFPREAIYTTGINSDSWYPPEWYVNFFRGLQTSREPFELTIIRGTDIYYEGDSVFPTHQNFFDTVFEKAVLLDLSISDKGGEPGDIYYNMSISEYRDASPKTLAELAEEKKDENGEVVEQKLVPVVNRPPQRGAIVPDRPVEVSGEVYETAETPGTQWLKAQRKANQINRVVTRVLPPSVSGTMHSVYLDGLGWVDQGSCKLAEDRGTVAGLKRVVNNEF